MASAPAADRVGRPWAETSRGVHFESWQWTRATSSGPTGAPRRVRTSRRCPICSTAVRARARCAASGPCTSTCCRRATTPARPARTSRPGSRTCNAGDHEQAWRQLVARQPVRRPSTAGSATTRARRSCNRRQLDSAVSIHAVERFLGDLALERGWQFERPRRRSGKRVLVIGAGPSGLSAAYHLARLGHDVEIRDAGPEPGGMMRYGIPAYRMPRDVLSAEVDRIAALGVQMTSATTGSRTSRRSAARAASTRSSSRSARTSSKRVDIPARDAGKIVDAVSFLRERRPRARRRGSAGGWRSTAAATPRWTRRASARRLGRRRDDDRLPPHRASRCRRTRRRPSDAEREGVRINWLRTITALRGARAAGRGDGARRVGLPAADRPVRDAGGRHRDPGARPGDATPRFLRDVPGRGVRARRHGEGVAVADDRRAGGVRRRRHGAGRADRDGRRRARQARRPRDRRVAARRRATSAAPSTRWPTFDKLHLWYFGDARASARSRSSSRTSASAGFEEVVGGLSAERGRRTRRPAACRAATAASATAAWAPARRTR